MQLGLKLVANLSTGVAAAVKPLLTPAIRRNLVKQTLALGETIGDYAGSIRVEGDSILVVSIKVRMPNGVVYASNGVAVPFAVEGVDGSEEFQTYAALYQLTLPPGGFPSDARAHHDIQRYIKLLSWEQTDGLDLMPEPGLAGQTRAA